jgi:hypothetical protein
MYPSHAEKVVAAINDAYCVASIPNPLRAATNYQYDCRALGRLVMCEIVTNPIGKMIMFLTIRPTCAAGAAADAGGPPVTFPEPSTAYGLPRQSTASFFLGATEDDEGIACGVDIGCGLRQPQPCRCWSARQE